MATGTAGCIGANVVHEINRSVMLEPQDGWVRELDGVDGSAEITYTVRSESSRFRVFYFTDRSDLETYQQFIGTDGGEESDPTTQPSGHEDLSRTAVKNDEEGFYVVEMPPDADRYSIEFQGPHYFVLDYSNYGFGDRVGPHSDILNATVSIRVVTNQFGLF